MIIAPHHLKSLDIETAPLPLAEIESRKPEFSAPANWKDPDKIRANIAEQEQKWLEKAALSPLTGRVLVIGLKEFGKDPTYLEGDERDILLDFWREIGIGVEFDLWHGHNLHEFDLRFIIRRSWFHQIPVPIHLIYAGRYVNDRRFIDTMKVFQCGDRQDFVSLRDLAQFLGLGSKDSSLSAHFSEVYATDRELALRHLGNDLDLVERVAIRMLGYQLENAA